MISIDQLKVTFGLGTPLETQALKGVDITINAGEFVTVIGSNGSGKSTLLNSLSGDVLPTSGSITVAENNVSQWSVDKRAPLIARVFQDPLAGTCESLTIEENMALAQHRGQAFNLTRALKKNKQAHFRSQLARLGLGLEDRLNDKIGLLSGGQRQAICLLMSALQPASILLLDEHTAALDPKTAAFVLQLTEQIIAENQLTTLMVTHSMQQALDVGSRTIMLHDGQVVFDIAGEARSKLSVNDLLALFKQNHKDEDISSDSLLLG